MKKQDVRSAAGYNKIVLLGITCVLAAVLAAILCISNGIFHPKNSASEILKSVPPARVDALLDDIMSVPDHPQWLTPNHSGTMLAYLRATSTGLTAFLLNLKSLAVTRLPTTNRVPHIYGWSPDDRFLAFLEAPAKHLYEERLFIYDAKDHSIKPLTSTNGLLEQRFAWLGEGDKYFYSTKSPVTDQIVDRYVGDWKNRTSHKTATYLNVFTPMSGNLAAFGRNGNIYMCLIDSPKPPRTVRLSNFSSEGFDDFLGRWLRYSKHTGTFLFCSTPSESNWRYLYKYDPVTMRLDKLNDVDTYNGQWIQHGGGYAFVGNRDNHFYLAVRPKEASEATNLFVNGSVENYTVNPAGDKIYITAAMDIEPQGIWEYNLETRTLRCVMPGTTNQYVLDHPAEPREYKIKSIGGITVTYFVYPPVSGTNAFSPELAKIKKYPVFFALPAPTAQAQKVYGGPSQFLANLGFYVVEVNCRGWDGYGKAYADMGRDFRDEIGAVEDAMNVYRKMIKNPHVDSKSVFLSCTSGSTPVVLNILQKYPEPWAGVVLDHPVGGFDYQSFNPRKLPPIMVITGDQDKNNLPWIKQMASWAATNGVKMKLFVEKNSGHINRNTEEAKEAWKQWLEFIK